MRENQITLGSLYHHFLHFLCFSKMRYFWLSSIVRKFNKNSFLDLIEKLFGKIGKKLEDRIILVSYLLYLNNVTNVTSLLFLKSSECTYGYEETTMTLDLLYAFERHVATAYLYFRHNWIDMTLHRCKSVCSTRS